MGAIDIEELGRWFERESPALVLFARQWLDASAAEDVVQDVFVSLSLQRVCPMNPRAWLYQAVRHRSLKVLRAWRRRLCREETVAREEPGWFEPRPGVDIDSRLAEETLARLTAEEREAITLRIWGGLTLEEIAHVIQTSVPTAFRRYRAGLKHLRNLMEVGCPLNTN